MKKTDQHQTEGQTTWQHNTSCCCFQQHRGMKMVAEIKCCKACFVLQATHHIVLVHLESTILQGRIFGRDKIMSPELNLDPGPSSGNGIPSNMTWRNDPVVKTFRIIQVNNEWVSIHPHELAIIGIWKKYGFSYGCGCTHRDTFSGKAQEWWFFFFFAAHTNLISGCRY